jgi:uncharacterized protein YoxC
LKLVQVGVGPQFPNASVDGGPQLITTVNGLREQINGASRQIDGIGHQVNGLGEQVNGLRQQVNSIE